MVGLYQPRTQGICQVIILDASIKDNSTFYYCTISTDYSLLTNGLVSMLTYFSMSGADKDYIPMFSWTNLFLAVLRLNNKVIYNPAKHKTWVSIWHENEAIAIG